MDWARIKENLVLAVVLPALGVVAGWLFGTSQMDKVTSQLTAINNGIVDLKAREDSHDRFAKCAEKRLYAIEAGIKKPPACAEGID